MQIIKDIERSRIVFHFNKAFLTDDSIPMWTIKHKGNTYYVHHLVSNIGFNTKETPDNEHTKGSIMFKGQLTITEQDGQVCALVS